MNNQTDKVHLVQANPHLKAQPNDAEWTNVSKPVWLFWLYGINRKLTFQCWSFTFDSLAPACTDCLSYNAFHSQILQGRGKKQTKDNLMWDHRHLFHHIHVLVVTDILCLEDILKTTAQIENRNSENYF